MSPSRLPALLQRFFTERLIGQLAASPHTVASYRDAFRLLLRFAAERLAKTPSELLMEDLDAAFLATFLESLEQGRGCSARTRNVRLAAIRAFFRYVTIEEPAYALHCQRVLAIPSKRCQRRSIEFLLEEQCQALIAAPDPATWMGRRDRTLLLVALQTGLRSSELTALRKSDIVLSIGAHIRSYGKGRKTRCTPLRRDVVPVLDAWLREQCHDSTSFVFPSSRGGRLSADALEHLVAKHAATAATSCPSLAGKQVTPHVLRHSAAMEMLRRGVDRSVIALWLGHESMETTQDYLHADIKLKEQALARAAPTDLPPSRYKPKDELLAFLESL